MSIDALGRKARERNDLATIPAMSAEERAALLAAYQEAATAATAQKDQMVAVLSELNSLEALRRVDIGWLRAAQATLRTYQAAQRSLGRIARAIAQAEKAEQAMPTGLIFQASDENCQPD